MKIVTKELNEAQNALFRLLTFQMDPKLSYRLMKVADVFRRTFKDIEKFRHELVRKYGEKKDNEITVPEGPKMEQFKSEWEKYLEQEIDIDVQLIPWWIILASGVKVSPVDMTLLGNFIDFNAKQPD